MRELKISRVDWIVALSSLGLLLACESEARNEPDPAVMCQTLAQQCRRLDSDFAKDCYEIGKAGVTDVAGEDQCFARFSACVEECVYLAPTRSRYLDAGGTDSGDPDAEAAPPAGDASAARSRAAARPGDASSTGPKAAARPGDASTVGLDATRTRADDSGPRPTSGHDASRVPDSGSP